MKFQLKKATRRTVSRAHRGMHLPRVKLTRRACGFLIGRRGGISARAWRDLREVLIGTR